MAANTVPVLPSFPINRTGTFIESLIGQVEKAEQRISSKAFARGWYVGQALEAETDATPFQRSPLTIAEVFDRSN